MRKITRKIPFTSISYYTVEIEGGRPEIKASGNISVPGDLSGKQNAMKKAVKSERADIQGDVIVQGAVYYEMREMPLDTFIQYSTPSDGNSGDEGAPEMQ